MKRERRKMTPQEAGRLGGLATRDNAKPGYYQDLGKKAGNMTKANNGIEHYKKIGEKGRNSRYKKEEG